MRIDIQDNSEEVLAAFHEALLRGLEKCDTKAPQAHGLRRICLQLQKCFPSVTALRDGLQLLFGKRTDIFVFSHRLLLIARAVLLLTVWHFQVPATSYLPAYTQSAEHKKRVSRYLCVSQ